MKFYDYLTKVIAQGGDLEFLSMDWDDRVTILEVKNLGIEDSRIICMSRYPNTKHYIEDSWDWNSNSYLGKALVKGIKIKPDGIYIQVRDPE